jgi:glyoxylase-like metal-dependent hydrolase (beta-lactamase superfamily II)
MFKIDMLPGGRGDALWIEYGKSNAPHRVMIDGGIAGTHKEIRKRIEAIDESKRRFDLLIITHIDLDHIAGVLEILAKPPAGLKFDNVLFNGWEQLATANDLPDDEGVLVA